MIFITFFHSADFDFCGFESKGHAESGIKGNSLVCASVTTLIQTVIMGLKDTLSLTLRIDKAESGFIKCLVLDTLNADEQAKVNLLFEVLKNGLNYLIKVNDNESSDIIIENKLITEGDRYGT